MIRTVRAAGFAAAALAFAASAVWGGPLQAWQGDAAPMASHYLDHGAAGAAVSDIGLNDESAEAAAAAPQTLAALAGHMMARAQLVLPAPRPLDQLVDLYAETRTEDTQQDCLANAVYFEARGESLRGQLAVAEVVLNRAESGRYPDTICEVVVQPWQFSFVRRGVIPRADRDSAAWRRAVAVARIAEGRLNRLLPTDVLWYHADYVSPGWGRRLARNTKIGLHIFYS